jgi:hypothetical protein
VLVGKHNVSTRVNLEMLGMLRSVDVVVDRTTKQHASYLNPIMHLLKTLKKFAVVQVYCQLTHQLKPQPKLVLLQQKLLLLPLQLLLPQPNLLLLQLKLPLLRPNLLPPQLKLSLLQQVLSDEFDFCSLLILVSQRQLHTIQ